MHDADGSGHLLTDQAALRTRYRDPHPAIAAKARPRIDPAAARFLATSPLFVLSTSSASGNDASPRGGPPGFVAVLDPERIAFGDLSGNNRLDSYGNIVEHDQVGMLFFVPGVGETLRVNGRASISTEPAVLDAVAIDGVTPKVAVVVAVEECYIHCAKALRRSGVWDPSTWLPDDQRTTAGEVIVDQYGLDAAPADVAAGLEADYQATLWVEGGATPAT